MNNGYSDSTTTVAVLTGAGSGMGRACIERLGSLADVVFAVDLDEPNCPDAVAIAADVSDGAAVRALVERVREAGSFRCLVHAAGISPTMGSARRVMEVDLIGTQLLLDAFDPLVTHGTAAVCFSSSAAYAVAPFMTPELEGVLADPMVPGFVDRVVDLVDGDSGFAYALAKVGVIRATARAAVAWGPRGGRANSIAPGLIDTPMGRQELARQPAMADMLAQTPLGRLGGPNEVAAVAAFLVSDSASFISGIDVLVDGGQVQGSRSAGLAG